MSFFNYDHGTGGVQFANGAGGILAQISAAGNAIFAGKGDSSFAGNLGIGTTSPSSKLTVVGVVQSTSGGFKFPDNTIQTTAAKSGLASVTTDITLTGNGTGSSPLGVATPLTLSAGRNVHGPILTVNHNTELCAIYVVNCSAIQAIAGESSIAIVATGGNSDTGTSGGNGGTFTGGNSNNAAGNGLDAYGGNGANPGGGGFAGYGVMAVGGYAGTSGSGGIGIYASGGQNPDSTYANAGEFSGNVDVTGNVSKSGGSFKIDHPLDPANKYLYHSFVESPDMMNIYNGNVITDGSGMATVTLPDWFEALNREFRYQLTVIGKFAQAIIASEIQNNQFTIRTDKSSVKVSWQVTGVRQDAWANAHRIPVEEDKLEKERGYYLHPELFNEPPQKSLEWERHPQVMQRLEAKRNERVHP